MEQNYTQNYKAGDYVSYGSSGIFQIADKRRESFGGEARDYYVLKPVYDRFSQVYVPADSPELETKLRSILSAEEIDEVIGKTERSDLSWNDDAKLRAEEFGEIIKSGVRSDILWVVKVLSLHKAETQKQRKKFYSSDEKLLETAQKIILEEFAFALDIGKDEVVPYIMRRIGIA